jgi:hypothetical protein
MTLLSNSGKKTGAKIGVYQLGKWRKGEQKGDTVSKHRQGVSKKAKRDRSSSRRGERVRRKTRLTSSEDTTGVEEEHVHSSEEDADPRGGLGDWNDDSENDEVGGEDNDEFWKWSPEAFSRM